MCFPQLVLNRCWRLLSVSRLNWSQRGIWWCTESLCNRFAAVVSPSTTDTRHCACGAAFTLFTLFVQVSSPWPVTEIGKAWLAIVSSCCDSLHCTTSLLQLRCRPHPATCSLKWFPVVCVEDGNLSANPRVFCSETESVHFHSKSYILLQPLACFK